MGWLFNGQMVSLNHEILHAYELLFGVNATGLCKTADPGFSAVKWSGAGARMRVWAKSRDLAVGSISPKIACRESSSAWLAPLFGCR